MNHQLLANNYRIINLIFAGVIVILFVYSFLFNSKGLKHPVPSASEWFTDQQIPSTGLSRSFSEIVRLDFREARKFNPYGIRIFAFFIFQLLLRVTGTLLVLHTHHKNLQGLIFADVILSGFLFILCFWPFIAYLVHL